MARPNLNLIQTIRHTARKLRDNAPYQWGHMGSCNCGHLAQEITRVSKADIHRFAMHSEGSWADQSRAYCPTSGLPMDLLISRMLDFGLEINDLEHLEKLSDPRVLEAIGKSRLKFNQREDVVLYMETWANLLEQALLSEMPVPELTDPKKAISAAAELAEAL